MKQITYLEQLAATVIPTVEMSEAERSEKEAFRVALQGVISDVCETEPQRLPRISLECFGSFQSGYASKDSDMDLAIVSQDQERVSACFSLMEHDLPRLLERRLLELGYGARLLTRTRVPIIKICETPTPELLGNLREERAKWDALPEEKKYPHLHGEAEADHAVTSAQTTDVARPDEVATSALPKGPVTEANNLAVTLEKTAIDVGNTETPADTLASGKSVEEQPAERQAARRNRDQKWTRERVSGPLDFPKDGVGIQSDINFFNPLGVHNTQMLRNYSLCDTRVRPMILFIKAWAKRRKINSAYSGTLSSYGYVLMVLHYLINVAQPPVLPNLQSPWRPNAQCSPPGATCTEVDNWVVDFWRSESEISAALQQGQMSRNRESIGSLLAGFFSYFSSVGNGPKFHWMKDVLALRVPGGILSKDEKGWVKAVTEESEGRKVQQRYLFCIEDPFELTHNVSRTVTHFGIVAIRDEFRRAIRILMCISNGMPSHEDPLMDTLVEEEASGVANGEQMTSVLRPAGTAVSNPTRGPRQQAPSHITNVQARAEPYPNHRKNMPGGHSLQPLPVQKGLNVEDDQAFPSLSDNANTAAKQQITSKPPRAKKPTFPTTIRQVVGVEQNCSEISGVRAKQYLDEVKRKNAEAHAETTAMGAAEAVLGDD